jgi:hypothetical protein
MGVGAGLHRMPAAIRFHFRDDWRDLKRSRPGRRFQERYERARRAEPHCGLVKRVATIAVASIAILLGVFFAVFPGPAIPFFFVGGALLATESRPLARGMDWIELRVRDFIELFKKRWRHLPLVGRIAGVMLLMGFSATMAYLMYRFVRG